jgi:hypothetical protein
VAFEQRRLASRGLEPIVVVAGFERVHEITQIPPSRSAIDLRART